MLGEEGGIQHLLAKGGSLMTDLMSDLEDKFTPTKHFYMI